MSTNKEKKKSTSSLLDKVPPPPVQYSLGRIIELHKFTWLPFALGMMVVMDTYTACGGLMAGMFGGYGVLWIVKSYTFWDKRFYISPKSKSGLGFVFIAAGRISVYYLFPHLAVKNSEEPLQAWETFCSSFFFGSGCFLHYATDAQKFFTLKHRGPGLITEGLFSRIRHPNYAGDYCMWLAMTVVAGCANPFSWIPLVYFVTITNLLFIPAKEKSLSRYPGYNEWKKQTSKFVPKFV